jgi:hypothetical protein
MPELRDVSTDQQDQGLAANLVIDRDAASRLGITASAIDNVLYDAFGQREVSTMYTALNQYYVVMEVDPTVSAQPRRAQRHLHQGQQCCRRHYRHASHRHCHGSGCQPHRRARYNRAFCHTDDAHRCHTSHCGQHQHSAPYYACSNDHIRAHIYRHRLRRHLTNGSGRKRHSGRLGSSFIYGRRHGAAFHHCAL